MSVAPNAQQTPMRILFVSTILPVPTTSGQAMRTLSIVRALSELGHDVDFVSFASATPDNLEPLSLYCRSCSIIQRTHCNASQRPDYFARLLALLKGKSYSIERFRSTQMRSHLGCQIANNCYDLILADSVFALVNLPETRIPLMLNCHNVEWMILKRFAQLERNPVKRSYARTEARRMLQAERSACWKSNIAMVCSEHDRDTLRKLRSNFEIFVVPNCVDVDSYAPSQPNPNSQPAPCLLFQGTMDWHPNCDAVEFFASKMLPDLRRNIPDVRFVAAGRNPSPQFRKKLEAAPGVEFTGTVPDIRPYLDEAQLVVVPLRIGSGTRLKILEAAAAGKPIVSTSLGAEGLEFVPGTEIVIADTPADFATEILSLLRDPERRNRMGSAARAKVTELYSQKTLSKTIKFALLRLSERMREPRFHGSSPRK